MVVNITVQKDTVASNDADFCVNAVHTKDE